MGLKVFGKWRVAGWRPLRALTLVGALLLGWPASPSAHEIPARVAILAYIKPEGNRLRLVVRVPLESMRDVEFPLTKDGNLDLSKVGGFLPDAARLWIADYVEFYENDVRLTGATGVTTMISLPSDRSFEDYAGALRHVAGSPLPVETQLRWQQAMLDIVLEYPIQSELSQFSVKPALAHLGVRTTTVLRFLPPNSPERVFQYAGNPGLVTLDPRWTQAAARFVSLGFFHILDGLDHLLFVLCLVIPIRRWRSLLAIITSFTIAHSITLFASALGLAPYALWFPPLVETMIAISIVFMALENILRKKEQLERRWMMAFGFGLVHGFGFSFALKESLQFAGSHLITSLAAFNVGVEFGQLAVLAVALPLLAVILRYSLSERVGIVVLSALVAHSGWHWMTERAAVLAEYRVGWPTIDGTFWLGVMRGAMLLLIAGGVGWLISGVMGRLANPGAATKFPVTPDS